MIPLLWAHRVGGEVLLGMPLAPSTKFQDALNAMTLKQMRRYLAKLLEALAHVHSLGIIHRLTFMSRYVEESPI